MNLFKKIKDILSHTGFQRYGRNAIWLIADRVLRLIVALLVGIWVAKFLGPEQFGLFNYALSLVMLFSALASLGLDSILIRDLLGGVAKEELLGSVFVLRFIAGCMVPLLLLFLSNFIVVDNISFIIAASFIFQGFNVIDLYFQSKVLSRYVVIVNIVSILFSSLIKVSLILIGAPLISFVWVMLLDSLTLSLGLVYFYQKRNLSIYNWNFSYKTSIRLLQESWPLILAGVAGLINMRMDQIMLGNLTSNFIVGNYAAATRISELWLILPSVLGASIYPAIIASKQKSQRLYKNRILNIIKYMSFFVIPFSIVISIMSDQIVDLLYGEQYSRASEYLALLIWTGVPYMIFFVLNQVLIIEKLAKISLYTSILTIVMNIGLNSILIPKMEGSGAAIASIIVAFTATLLAVSILYRKLINS